MGNNQSREEKEIIISQAGNSGGVTGLSEVKFSLWEVLVILGVLLVAVAVGIYTWRRGNRAVQRKIRDEIAKSHELIAIRAEK